METILEECPVLQPLDGDDTDDDRPEPARGSRDAAPARKAKAEGASKPRFVAQSNDHLRSIRGGGNTSTP